MLSMSAAVPSVSAIYYWLPDLQLAFLGAHDYTFHVRPTSHAGILNPWAGARRTGDDRLKNPCGLLGRLRNRLQDNKNRAGLIGQIDRRIKAAL
jgi:hypothetical protein